VIRARATIGAVETWIDEVVKDLWVGFGDRVTALATDTTCPHRASFTAAVASHRVLRPSTQLVEGLMLNRHKGSTVSRPHYWPEDTVEANVELLGYRRRRDSTIKLTTVMVTPFKLSLPSVPPLRYAPKPPFVSLVQPLIA
jgi:hypothetical protein